MGVTKAQFSQISSEIFNGIGSADLLHGCYDHLQQQQAINHTTHLRLTTSHKSHLYETIFQPYIPSQKLFILESLQTRDTKRNFCFMVLHFLLVNEYLKATFFLILWKFIFENKRVTINTWAGVYLITWKHCRF